MLCDYCVLFTAEAGYHQSCTLEGTNIEHGSRYEHDSCETTCYCNNGELQCQPLICPAATCPEGELAIFVAGKCCQILKECKRASLKQDPDSCVADKRMNCERCRCVQGRYQCFYDETLCESFQPQPRGRCVADKRVGCMRCRCIRRRFNCRFDPTLCRPASLQSTAPQSCLLDGTVIEHGSRSEDDSCKLSCYCNNGELECKPLICPYSECPKGELPVLEFVPGQCCQVLRECMAMSHKEDPCVEDERMNCGRCRCIEGRFNCFYDETLCENSQTQSEVELTPDQDDPGLPAVSKETSHTDTQSI